MLSLFTEPFFLTALGVGVLTAAMCAFVGNFVLMKGMSFIAIALSEIAAVGVALGFVLELQPDLAALVASFAGVVYFWRQGTRSRRFADGRIGLIYATSAALVLIIIAKSPGLEAHGIDLVSGNLLYATIPDLVLIAGVAGVVGVLHVVFRKEFLFVSFDAETAGTLGVRAGGMDLLLMLSLGAVIAFAMKLTGMLFVFASLIIPGLAGLCFFQRVHQVFLFSVVLAVVCVVAGMMVSFQADLPTSPTIICAYALGYAAVQAWSAVSKRFRVA